MTDTPEFPPVADGDWPAALDDMRGSFATGLNVYRTMAHHPDLLRAWAPLRGHLVPKPSLGAERSEVVILRTGHRLGSEYEWAHHVYRARKLGMSDARIGAMRGAPADMDAEDAVLCRAVDELFDAHGLSAGSITALVALVGREGMFDLIATVGFYSVLGFMLNSFGTPVDEDVAASLAADPFPA